MKCLENILLNHLLTVVSSCLHPHQFACQPRRGVDDALLTMTNSILELEWPSTFVKIAFIDFSNAFYTTQPNLLVDKLAGLGVNQKLKQFSNKQDITG